MAGRKTPSPEGYSAHETACIDEPVEIGAGTKIWHFSHIMSGARIGRNCNIGQNVFVASTAVLGDNVKVQNNVSVYDGVVLENNVFCGPSMVFTNVTSPRCEYPRRGLYEKTVVREGATIGANATVVCGHTIGRYAFVGAGAVVTKDVPDHALVYGNPAAVKGWMCVCGEKLAFNPPAGDETAAVCRTCGKQYRRKGFEVRRVR